jgi:hypothetical protein
MEISAEEHGTKEPICAMSTITPACTTSPCVSTIVAPRPIIEEQRQREVPHDNITQSQ